MFINENYIKYSSKNGVKMNMLKKTLVASALVLGFSSMANAATATAVWTGEVPGSSHDDKIIITGPGGSNSGFTGTLTAFEDGTFHSTEVIMESRENTGTVETPEVGELLDANWTISAADVVYDGRPVDGTVLKVDINGTKYDVGDALADVANRLTVKLEQTAPLAAADVAETTAQASLTMLASAI
ncbi:hypothetical protein FCV62_22100 [Vibrio kanaloae]|uniref:hypothetical protein n=1 Tax=Vibrio kanaloae TaxID=170673 RepID=UPI0010BE5277|nr:hypothetical protein [Vibrio kanaloae]TKF73684.1 hypothetical protein FCV62_22100 [Vibrio kanaloae]